MLWDQDGKADQGVFKRILNTAAQTILGLEANLTSLGDHICAGEYGANIANEKKNYTTFQTFSQQCAVKGTHIQGYFEDIPSCCKKELKGDKTVYVQADCIRQPSS